MKARRALTVATVVHFSAASVWELTIKSMLGKLELPADFGARLADYGLSALPVTTDHATGIREFPELVRHDPFDRILVSQAAQERLSLLTADTTLLRNCEPRLVIDATQ
ncbi:MAG: type II toxin-antitoxin system VapC family toxin [Nocardioidaceae bacterium]